MKLVAGDWFISGRFSPGARCQTPTSESGSVNGRGLSSTPLTTLKMAVLAPMPSARVRMATTVNPGVRRRRRVMRPSRAGTNGIRRLYGRKWPEVRLLVPQRDDRIDLARAPRRQPDGEERDD